MRTLFLSAALIATLLASDAYAQTAAQTLGTCLTDNTTGRDRKDLARWIFTALAAHPEMDTLSAVTPDQRDGAAQAVGALFTRLFAESCTEEVRTAMAEGGSSVIEAGFGILGEVAMQELMRHQEVSNAMTGMVEYIDMAKLEAAVQQQ